MYNSKDMLPARKIARKENEKEVQEKEDSEEARSLELFEKTDQGYMLHTEGGSLLANLGKERLQGIVRFLC